MVIHSSDLNSNASTHSRLKAGSAPLSANKADTAESATAPKAPTQPSQQVQLSQEAQSIERLETKIQNSEGVDTAKVDLIKQQIADGNYEVNSSNIADKLLSQDSLLG